MVGIVLRKAVTVAASATFLALALPTGPARADEVGGGVAAFNVCSGTHCVVGTLNTRVYPTGLGTDIVEFECTITASGAAVSTSVTACSVGPTNALLVPLSAPGPAVATAGVGLFPAGSSLTACVTGSAVWAEGILGPISLGGNGCGRVIAVSIG